MSHHQDAETLLQMADESALRALEASKTTDNPWAVLPGITGAVVHLLAAQVHATLALAEATERRS